MPITEVLPDIRQQLLINHELILEAPPGAGKTTLVPLALLDEAWLGNQRILMLEPRRMAARAAAQRMAVLLGEKVGETVGFRVRQETKVGPRTRIEIVTEGILNRMLVDNPALSSVALLIFDEFHERSLDADVGLALALQGRALFRETENPLRVMLMSATLNGEALSRLLPQAPVVRSEGRQFPVELHYGKAWRFDDDIVSRTVDAVVQALAEHSGNLLVFLPGQREILRVQEKLEQRLPEHTEVLPLYGSLSLQEQQRAVDPTTQGQRKIVLATDIAETSLTIEGISAVVDSGLSRQPQFDPNSGMTRLHTRRISADSSTQRAGRAGRLSAGHCYRLWSEEQQGQLEKFRSPEILQADLAPLMLQLMAWGVDDLSELDWLDLPPTGATRQALDLLQRLGAVAGHSKAPVGNDRDLSQWQLTAHGEAMATLPAHPRLAHMLIAGYRHGLRKAACALAALLAERSPLDREFGADLSLQLAVVLGDHHCPARHKGWLQRSRRQAAAFDKLLKQDNPTDAPSIDIDSSTGFLLACAYPERIARKLQATGSEYQLANGQIADLDAEDALVSEPWIAVAELGGIKRAGQSRQQHRIFSAAAFNPDLLDDELAELVTQADTMYWDDTKERFIAEHCRNLGKLVLSSKPLDNPAPEVKTAAILELVRKRGLDILPWDESTRQWQARVQLLHQLYAADNDTESADAEPWPDVSNNALLDSLEQWLAPYINNVSRLIDLQKLDLASILAALLPWPLPRQLEELCPERITVPSGSQLKIDYQQEPPVLRVKLQEMFGCADTPTVANGRLKLMLHLLSPAQRPLQVTQDLAGFWKTSYFDVQKEMKGRYPKHPWPDDPMQAQATRYTKRSGR